MDIREKVVLLPLSPGVYLYKDAHGKVIYVGKAKSLRARVRSYFAEDRLADSKTDSLLSEARDVDYILVDNEHEARGVFGHRSVRTVYRRLYGIFSGFPASRAPSSVVEHVTFNHGVPGSIPGGPTILRSRLSGEPELRMASRLFGSAFRDV